MTKLTRNELLEALAQYGYELDKPLHQYTGEEVLFNLLKENDSRLLEGFPVAYKHLLDSPEYAGWDRKTLSFQKGLSDKDRRKLFHLLLVSYFLLKLYGEEKPILGQTEDLLSTLSADWKTTLKEVEEKFNNGESLEFDHLSLSTDRLKKQYRNYVVHSNLKTGNEPKMDMELELLLSEFFTSKQKELIKKRLSGQELSKTEREVFSRVVNKRLKALANENLFHFVRSMASSRAATMSS